MHFVQSHPAFNDTIDSLKHEFRDDRSNTVIICGAHDLKVVGFFRQEKPVS